MKVVRGKIIKIEMDEKWNLSRVKWEKWKLAVISHRGALTAPKWQYFSRSSFTSDMYFRARFFVNHFVLLLFSFKKKFKTKWKMSILGFLFRCKGDISDAWCTTQWETKTVHRRWRWIRFPTKICESGSWMTIVKLIQD